MGLLVDDLGALQPTLLSAPPRFWNMMFEEYEKRVLEGEKSLSDTLTELEVSNRTMVSPH